MKKQKLNGEEKGVKGDPGRKAALHAFISSLWIAESKKKKPKTTDLLRIYKVDCRGDAHNSVNMGPQDERMLGFLKSRIESRRASVKPDLSAEDQEEMARRESVAFLDRIGSYAHLSPAKFSQETPLEESGQAEYEDSSDDEDNEEVEAEQSATDEQPTCGGAVANESGGQSDEVNSNSGGSETGSAKTTLSQPSPMLHRPLSQSRVSPRPSRAVTSVGARTLPTFALPLPEHHHHQVYTTGVGSGASTPSASFLPVWSSSRPKKSPPRNSALAKTKSMEGDTLSPRRVARTTLLSTTHLSFPPPTDRDQQNQQQDQQQASVLHHLQQSFPHTEREGEGGPVKVTPRRPPTMVAKGERMSFSFESVKTDGDRQGDIFDIDYQLPPRPQAHHKRLRPVPSLPLDHPGIASMGGEKDGMLRRASVDEVYCDLEAIVGRSGRPGMPPDSAGGRSGSGSASHRDDMGLSHSGLSLEGRKGFVQFLSMLYSDDQETKGTASEALRRVAGNARLHAQLLKSPLPDELLAMVLDRSDPQLQLTACTCLSFLCRFEENRPKLIEKGFLNALLSVIASPLPSHSPREHHDAGDQSFRASPPDHDPTHHAKRPITPRIASAVQLQRKSSFSASSHRTPRSARSDGGGGGGGSQASSPSLPIPPLMWSEPGFIESHGAVVAQALCALSHMCKRWDIKTQIVREGAVPHILKYISGHGPTAATPPNQPTATSTSTPPQANAEISTTDSQLSLLRRFTRKEALQCVSNLCDANFGTEVHAEIIHKNGIDILVTLLCNLEEEFSQDSCILKSLKSAIHLDLSHKKPSSVGVSLLGVGDDIGIELLPKDTCGELQKEVFKVVCLLAKTKQLKQRMFDQGVLHLLLVGLRVDDQEIASSCAAALGSWFPNDDHLIDSLVLTCGVNPLISLLTQSHERKTRVDCAFALAHLSEHPRATAALLASGGESVRCLLGLAKTLDFPSLLILSNLCKSGAEARAVMRSQNAHLTCLELLMSHSQLSVFFCELVFKILSGLGCDPHNRTEHQQRALPLARAGCVSAMIKTTGEYPENHVLQREALRLTINVLAEWTPPLSDPTGESILNILWQGPTTAPDENGGDGEEGRSDEEGHHRSNPVVSFLCRCAVQAEDSNMQLDAIKALIRLTDTIPDCRSAAAHCLGTPFMLHMMSSVHEHLQLGALTLLSMFSELESLHSLLAVPEMVSLLFAFSRHSGASFQRLAGRVLVNLSKNPALKDALTASGLTRLNTPHDLPKDTPISDARPPSFTLLPNTQRPQTRQSATPAARISVPTPSGSQQSGTAFSAYASVRPSTVSGSRATRPGRDIARVTASTFTSTSAASHM